jgi:hypothetical protein
MDFKKKIAEAEKKVAEASEAHEKSSVEFNKKQSEIDVKIGELQKEKNALNDGYYRNKDGSYSILRKSEAELSDLRNKRKRFDSLVKECFVGVLAGARGTSDEERLNLAITSAEQIWEEQETDA